MGITIRSCGKVEVRGYAGDPAIRPKRQSPEPVDGYRTIARALKQSVKVAEHVEGHNGPARAQRGTISSVSHISITHSPDGLPAKGCDYPTDKAFDGDVCLFAVETP